MESRARSLSPSGFNLDSTRLPEQYKPKLQYKLSKGISFDLSHQFSLQSATMAEDEPSIDQESRIENFNDFIVKSRGESYFLSTDSGFHDEEKQGQTNKDGLIKKIHTFFNQNDDNVPIAGKTDTVIVENNDLINEKEYKWNLMDVKLLFLIQKNETDFMWEAENTVLRLNCTVRVILAEYTRLLNNDYSRTKALLEKLVQLQNPNVMKTYHFSILETDEYLVIVIVHEPVYCSLLEYLDFRIRKKEDFLQTEILQIIGEVNNKFFPYKTGYMKIKEINLSNLFIFKDGYSIKVSDFDLKLPLIANKEEITRTSLEVQTKGKKHLTIFRDGSARLLFKLETEQYVRNLSLLAFQLLTKSKGIKFSITMIEEDINFQKKYPILLYLLSLRWEQKNFHETLTSIYTRHNTKNIASLDELVKYIARKPHEQENLTSYIEKDQAYEYIQNPKAALETLANVKNTLANKSGKIRKEYYQYLLCVNRALKHLLVLKDFKRIEELNKEFMVMLKQHIIFPKVLSQHIDENIEHIFLQAQIQEATNHLSKAKELYIQGLNMNKKQNTPHKNYHFVLKRLIHINRLQKDEQGTLKYCEMLRDFYSDKSGLYLEKAELYCEIADILARQGHHGRAVKFYVQALETLDKRIITPNEVYIEIYEKIIKQYEVLKDDEKALKYLLEQNDLNLIVYGKVSEEYVNGLKRICEHCIKSKKFLPAVEHYLNYIHLLDTLYGHGNEKYSEALINLSEIYIGIGNYDKALEVYDEYATISEEWNGVHGQKSFILMDNLANIFFKKEELKGSVEVQLKSLPIKERFFGKFSKYYIVSVNNLGDTYFAMKQYEKALRYHLTCLNVLKCGKIDSGMKDHIKILLNIAYDYEKLGNYGKALNFLYQSLELGKTQDFLFIESVVEEFEALNKLKKKRVKRLNFNEIILDTYSSF